MSLTERVKVVYLDRLTELIQSGESIPMKPHSRVTSSNFLTGEKTYRHFNLASWSEFVEWRTSCIAVLDQVVSPASLLRKTVDHFDQLSNEPDRVEFAISFLRSVRAELERALSTQLGLWIPPTEK